jgi:hypothetical protein
VASTVVRIDYQDISATFNLNDLAYITYCSEDDEGEPIKVLRIFLTFGEASTIIIEESNPDEFEELKTLYLDLYTKWRNKADADKTEEAQLLNNYYMS